MKRSSLVLLLISLVLSSPAWGQIKKPGVPAAKVPFSESLQAVVVTTKGWTTISGTALLFERKTLKSEWKSRGAQFPVVVGKNGLGTTRDDARQLDGTTVRGVYKKEGDGRSPAGLFPLTLAFGIDPPRPSTKLPFTKIEEFTECVDDIGSQFYNRIINRMQVGNFDWKSSEKMFSVRPEYDLGIFVAYNSYPPGKGDGSCIFMHIWRDAKTGTAGCTAMDRSNLEGIVKWVDPKKNPYLIQLTVDQYRQYQRSWNLPKLN